MGRVHHGGQANAYAYSYNAARRMIEVTLGGSENGAYAYDFAGRRVWRQTFGSGAGQTAYVSGLDGHVQSKASATAGTPEREHIWLGDLLVGEIIWSSGTPGLYAVTTGFIDDPQLMTNASAGVVWSLYIAPQGGSGEFGTATQTLTLRYPGQWVQTEVSSSSSNQNWMRDYQPYMGRYMTADRLGIDAGPNPYTYADGDPLNESDPAGMLGPWQAPVPGTPVAVAIPNPPPGYDYQGGGGVSGAAIGPAGGASASVTAGVSYSPSNPGNASLIIPGQVAAGAGSGMFLQVGPSGYVGMGKNPKKVLSGSISPYAEVDAGTPVFSGSISGTFDDCWRLNGGSAAAGGRVGARPGGGGGFIGVAGTGTIAIKFRELPRWVPVILPVLLQVF